MAAANNKDIAATTDSAVKADEYTSRTGQKDASVPVQSDDDNVNSGLKDRETQNSDEQLDKDDAEAIDQSNVIGQRTRGGAKAGSLREPGDEEGIPTDD